MTLYGYFDAFDKDSEHSECAPKLVEFALTTDALTWQLEHEKFGLVKILKEVIIIPSIREKE